MKKIIIKDKWPDGISDGLSLKCQRCGHLPYIDYNVTDVFWKKVVPEELRLGVICLRCLDELATQIDENVANYLIRLQFTGKGKTLEMTPKQVFYYS